MTPVPSPTVSRRRPLDDFLSPREVAVIGACEHPESLGRIVLLNLLAGGFSGAIHPVDRSGGRILGIEVRTDLTPLAGRIDLAVIAVDRHGVADALSDCLAARVPAAVVMASDILDPALVATCRRQGLRLLGAGSFGVINPLLRLNASCAPAMPGSGRVAFLSQSGGLCSAILDWGRRKRFGFSSFVALGGMADLGWGELFDWFAADSATDSLVIAMETIGDLRAFLGAARELAITKPVVALKARRTAACATARGSMVGIEADAVVDAAFRRAGVLRADTLEELFALTEALAKQPRPVGRRLAVVGNASGLAVLAADALAAGGGELAALELQTQQALAHVSDFQLENPIYLGADAGPDRYLAAAKALCADPNVDGLLAILAPQEMTDPLRCAAALVSATVGWRRPVLACWMGGARSDGGRDLLNERGIAVHAYPDAAARTFARLAEHGRILDELYATPAEHPEDALEPDAGHVAAVLAKAQAEGRSQLAAEESASLLTAYRIPRVPRVPRAVVSQAADARTAAPAWELAIEVRTDPEIGPVVGFGAGGEHAAVIDDRAIDVAPLDVAQARQLILRTRVGQALARDPRYDLDPLARLLERLARLACDHPRLARIDIDPLLFSESGPPAVAARIAMHPWSVAATALPRPALRPYPAEYASRRTLPDGTTVTIRPIRPTDELRLIHFHRGLSDETVTMRYFRHFPIDQRTAHRRLARICFSDHDRDLVLVVEHATPDGERTIQGVGRLSRNRWADEAELAIVVADAWQHRGLAGTLVGALLDIARSERIGRVKAWMLPANVPMQRLLEQHGFALSFRPGEALTCAELVPSESR